MVELEDLRAEVERLKGVVEQMKEEMYAMNEARALENAETRQMVARLRSAAPKTKSEITEDRISRLDRLLYDCYPRGRTFDELGTLLQMGPNHKQIMTSFSRHILPFADDRYIFDGSPCARGTGKTARLTPAWRAHLKREYSKKDSISWDP